MFNQDQLKKVEQTPKDDLEQEINSTAPAPTTPPSDNNPATAKTAMENTDIYYMPENFQKNNQVAGRNINISGVVILVLGIIFLIILGIGLYLYLVKPGFLGNLGKSNETASTVVETVNLSETITPTALEATPIRPVGVPKDTYLAFRSELELADTVDKYIAVFVRYGTKDKQDQLTSQKSSLESVGGQGDILSTLRGTPVPPLDGTEDIGANISDDKAILTVSKTSGRQTGTIILLAEDGQWKISTESWIESSTEISNEEGQPTAALDDDQDGLSDLEEVLLGTDPQTKDSDTDGYDDAEELNNGYNPAGPGKLTANESLGTYLNTTFNFSLFYPTSWNRTIASADDSVIFTAANHQFIQMLVQPNSEQSDIVDWYRQTFNVQSIPNNQLVINESWDGVKTTDGLTVYLTSKNKAYIFVVTYNLGASKVLEYKNIFDATVRSLQLGS